MRITAIVLGTALCFLLPASVLPEEVPVDRGGTITVTTQASTPTDGDVAVGEEKRVAEELPWTPLPKPSVGSKQSGKAKLIEIGKDGSVKETYR